mmetsp:Transcript_144662/g.360574  ORF Transcript_144662/g.360574 Transcript_144662/m.360574 type:complete len:238 (-) Transcript_144662:564-1277(-)
MLRVRARCREDTTYCFTVSWKSRTNVLYTQLNIDSRISITNSSMLTLQELNPKQGVTSPSTVMRCNWKPMVMQPPLACAMALPTPCKCGKCFWLNVQLRSAISTVMSLAVTLKMSPSFEACHVGEVAPPFLRSASLASSAPTSQLPSTEASVTASSPQDLFVEGASVGGRPSASGRSASRTRLAVISSSASDSMEASERPVLKPSLSSTRSCSSATSRMLVFCESAGCIKSTKTESF